MLYIAAALRKLVRTVVRFVVITRWLDKADQNERDLSITWDGSDAIRVEYKKIYPNSASVRVATRPVLGSAKTKAGKSGSRSTVSKKSGTSFFHRGK